jgi:hypothetical protein
MKFEEALPLMRKGIVCTCDGVSWTVNEKHEWLRWYGTSFRIDSGPSNDQILGGEWEREGGCNKYLEFNPAEAQVFAPKPNLDRLEARLTYLELLHKVQWGPDQVIPWPLADEVDRHMKKGWI